MASREEPASAKEAIDLTLRTIERRARLYRNLVAGVVAMPMGSLVSALCFRSWWPLLGVCLLVPATGIYLAVDSWQVRRWAQGILDLRRTKGLDVESFSSIVLTHPWIPKRTVGGMLERLENPAPKSIGKLSSEGTGPNFSGPTA
jgi:hypothetical protein